MDLISSCDGKRIIDVGSGATTLVDTLLSNDYEVTVLDVSSEAIRILSKRHGNNMNYVQGDLTKELELKQYDIWHDRAVLHFLLDEEQKRAYVKNLESCISSGGYAIIETFAIDGAQMCCGLQLCTYDEAKLRSLLGEGWKLIHSLRHIHINPFGGERPYVSAIFQRK